MINKTGRFGGYFNGGERAHLEYERLTKRITEAVSDGRDYLIWVRSSNASTNEPGRMFTNDVKRTKVSVRIVLADYKETEIEEYTILPCDGFSHPDIEKFSLPGKDEWPICIARIGDVYLEEAGWIAPNYQPAWFRISADKYKLTSNEIEEKAD